MKKTTVAIAIAVIALAGPAHAKFRFSSSGFKAPSRSINLSKPPVTRVTKPTPVKVAPKTVYVPTRTVKTTSGHSTGAVLGAAALAGVAGYAIANTANASQHHPTTTTNTTTNVLIPAAGNSVISCLSDGNNRCNVGHFDSPLTIQQYATKQGYTQVVRTAVMFNGGKQYILAEVK